MENLFNIFDLEKIKLKDFGFIFFSDKIICETLNLNFVLKLILGSEKKTSRKKDVAKKRRREKKTSRKKDVVFF